MAGPVKDWIRKRRRRRHKLLAKRKELRAQRRLVAALISDRKAASSKEARQEIIRELLAARHELDRLEDQARARRARVARAVRGLRRARRAKQAPALITRAEWGAAPPRGSYVRQPYIRYRVQHHTAEPTLSDQASVAEESARMRQMQAGHFANGWTDLAYCRVVFPSGRVYEGRPAEMVGAHTLGHNTGYRGIALDGNYEISQPTVKAIQSCRRTWHKDLGDGSLEIFGHYQLTPTACPGEHMKPRVQSL